MIVYEVVLVGVISGTKFYYLVELTGVDCCYYQRKYLNWKFPVISFKFLCFKFRVR